MSSGVGHFSLAAHLVLFELPLVDVATGPGEDASAVFLVATEFACVA